MITGGPARAPGEASPEAPASTISGSMPSSLARKLVPEWAKRAHQRTLDRRYAREATERNRRVSDASGLAVSGGPMCGLQYPSWAVENVADLVSKLTGSYESQLHAALRDWLDSDLSDVVDIGSSEGYYAVGLAVAKPNLQVVAYDLDPEARRRVSEMATLNSVADRIDIRAEATVPDLASLSRPGTAVLCDCEGAEFTLLDPTLVPWLREAPMIVELHDFADARITPALRERFSETHRITLVDEAVPDPSAYPRLTVLANSERARALDERRPCRMTWAVMNPR